MFRSLVGRNRFLRSTRLQNASKAERSGVNGSIPSAERTRSTLRLFWVALRRFGSGWRNPKIQCAERRAAVRAAFLSTRETYGLLDMDSVRFWLVCCQIVTYGKCL